MNSKIIPIIFLIIVLGIGFVAVKFYSDKTNLTAENTKLKEARKSLEDENNSLRRTNIGLDKQNKDMQRKLSAMDEELSRLEEEKESLRKQVVTISKERDLLKERLAETPKAVKVTEATPAEGIPEEHWADFVKAKASLQVSLENLNKQLFEEKTKINELEKANKELSLKIDQLAKEKARLGEEAGFKERTIRVMSMDLVSEREQRAAAVDELRKLRNENVSLKRELVLANKEQVRMQDKLKTALEKRSELEDKIGGAENILRERSLAMEELQKQLVKTIDGGREVMMSESASVELPPIVVKPGSPGLKGLRGEVISVVRDENFVVVDIGESAGLRPGALLRIVRGDKEIGTVEVVETRKEISAANIEEIVGGYNIQEGDTCITR